jgi:hypothetical protein
VLCTYIRKGSRFGSGSFAKRVEIDLRDEISAA